MNKRQIKIQDINGVNYDCEMSFIKHPLCKINIICPDKSIIEIEGDDLFECLINLRIQFKQLKFLCNGSRKDVYPSRMSRQMSGGLMAYTLKIGQPTLIEDLVNIFDFAEAEKIVSPEEQEEFYKKWLDSL